MRKLLLLSLGKKKKKSLCFWLNCLTFLYKCKIMQILTDDGQTYASKKNNKCLKDELELKSKVKNLTLPPAQVELRFWMQGSNDPERLGNNKVQVTTFVILVKFHCLLEHNMKDRKRNVSAPSMSKKIGNFAPNADKRATDKSPELW